MVEPIGDAARKTPGWISGLGPEILLFLVLGLAADLSACRVLPGDVGSSVLSISGHLVIITLLYHYAREFHDRAVACVASIAVAANLTLIYFAVTGGSITLATGGGMLAIASVRRKRWRLVAMAAVLIGGACLGAVSAPHGAGWPLEKATIWDGINAASGWCGLDTMPPVLMLLVLFFFALLILWTNATHRFELALVTVPVAAMAVLCVTTGRAGPVASVLWTLPLTQVCIASALARGRLKGFAALWLVVVISGGFSPGEQKSVRASAVPRSQVPGTGGSVR